MYYTNSHCNEQHDNIAIRHITDKWSSGNRKTAQSILDFIRESLQPKRKTKRMCMVVTVPPRSISDGKFWQWIKQIVDNAAIEFFTNLDHLRHSCAQKLHSNTRLYVCDTHSNAQGTNSAGLNRSIEETVKMLSGHITHQHARAIVLVRDESLNAHTSVDTQEYLNEWDQQIEMDRNDTDLSTLLTAVKVCDGIK